MKSTHILAPLLAALACQGLAQPSAPAEDHWTLLEGYCLDCHNQEDWAGGVAFDLLSPETLADEAEVWETAVRKLRGRLMPPPGSEQPARAEVQRLVSWLEGELDSAGGLPRAGHVPVARLNRDQYANAVRDLLAVDIDPADYLPADMEVEGFDNIAAALSVSPSFLDGFLSLARVVAKRAVGDAKPKEASAYYPVRDAGDQDFYLPGMPLGTRGGMRVEHFFPADGEYRFNIIDLDVGLYPRAIESRHTLVLLVDGEEVFRDSLGGPDDLALINTGGAPAVDELMQRFRDIPVTVSAGTHEVAVTFIERARVETIENIGGFVAYGGFNFQGALRVPRVLDGIEIQGPFNAAGLSDTPSRDKIFSCYPEALAEEDACARRIAGQLGRLAYRRPLAVADIEHLMGFFAQGREEFGGFDAGVEAMIAAMLASPDFLFRGVSPARDIGDAPEFALSDLELASRLSFFLWNSLPDDELLSLAEAGELQRPEVLSAQVRRLLDDPRAGTLVNNFALKWLNLDDLDAVEPDPSLFPAFDGQLREDFNEELRLFLASILLEDRPVTELLDAPHSFVNARLAQHYGIEDIHGSQFRRVDLGNPQRWGLLGKGAVLLRTSYGDRTSPVLRGAWVLEKLQGTPPSPPPPNVETDLSVPEGEKATTVRARLERHRDTPGCNQCHGVIDPMGLALENFDAIGRWRDEDTEAGVAIDASTVLPDGRAISGPAELREALAGRPEQFAWAFTEKLMMYALGRELEYFDMPQLRAIVRGAAEQDWRLSAIVQGIVASEAFRKQARAHEGRSLALESGEMP